ncbi:rho guanine nucleotide exchange factor 39 [Sceloporus undulatus]|uniref:rho guanine nucleotide exchange factor 39 n=1 Tax=Sceloporus undulatus TaxID=8520 RepID=UPI001C4CAD5A|nr:rho guanine nucleotide exchange factor 39 [Sceloporus undulatus]
MSGAEAWAGRRARAAAALLETEEAYLAQLEALGQHFGTLSAAKGILRPEARETLFGPWEALRPASRALLGLLERGLLGPGLEGFRAHLPLYVSYAEKLPQARETLRRQVRKNKAFSRFKKLQESRPEFGGLCLEELLLLPLQRLRQYRHLLQDLVENTPTKSSEAEQLREALRSIEEAFHQVQEITHFHENVGHLSRIQKLLLLKGQKTKVMLPGRWYLREGWLTVVPDKGEALQHRMFFLFSDALLMTKPYHPLHPWNAHKLACQEVFQLQQCLVEKIFGHTQSHGGLLSLSFPHKKLLLMSHDQEDLNKWHQSLTAAIRRLQLLSRPLNH